MPFKKTSSGFTIVELLIVIVIIGILAALIVAVYNGIQQRAAVATLQTDLRNAAKVLEEARIDNNDQYPLSFPGTYKTSAKVTLNLAETGDSSTFCINGSYEGLTEQWKYDKTTDGLQSGSCSGQIISGSDVGGGGTKINYVANPNFTSGWALYKQAGTASTSTRSGTGSDPAGNRPVLVIQNNASTPTWAYISGSMNATLLTAGKTYVTSYWGRRTGGVSVAMGTAGVQNGNATNTVLSIGSASTALTTNWQKFSAIRTAQINGLSSSVFYIGVNNGNLNQNVTIELQDPKVEEQ